MTAEPPRLQEATSATRKIQENGGHSGLRQCGRGSEQVTAVCPWLLLFRVATVASGRRSSLRRPLRSAAKRDRQSLMKDILPPADEVETNQGGRPDVSRHVPHTQVHTLLRRSLETLQDIIAVLLMVLLLVLALQTLWRLAQIAITETAPTAELLSEIVFVLILMEVYRLMIYYLREHRISVTLTVEVALVSTLREVMLKGVQEFEWVRLVAISLFLIVLGGLLAMERWTGRCRNGISEIDAH
jgi:uncharacterized membrane protein (DUF373 family)